MRDRETGERILMELSHSPAVYRSRYRFPLGYFWAYPAAACAALSEVMPWEALGLSFLISSASCLLLGRDLGAAIAVSATLALITLQMLRARTFVTPFRVVRTRGLFAIKRTEIHLAMVHEARVEYPQSLEAGFGDLVLSTQVGESRFRAIRDPEVVLERLLTLKASGQAEGAGA